MEGEVAKMVQWEEAELTSSCWHTKIMTTHKAAIYENDLKMSRKDFPPLMTKKEPRQDEYRGKGIVQSDVHLWAGNSQKKKYHNHSSPPHSWWSVPHIGSPIPRVLRQEDEPPEHPALKTSDVDVQESWMAM